MTEQYLRKFSLTAGNEAGDKLEFNEFRCVFQISRATVQTPNSAIVRIYNLSSETFEKLRKEFKKVEIRAGYEGSFGAIFTGTIRQARRVRESPVDSYVEISAGDGDQAYNFGVVSTSLAAGNTAADRVAALDQSMQPEGVEPGYRPTSYGDNPSPRGTVLFGMARDGYRTEAQNLNGDWSVQDGRVNIVPQNGAVPGPTIILNSETGLIGFPEQTEIGVTATCLINPNVRIDALVKIDNRSVTEVRTNLSYTALNLAQTLVKVADDGQYRVLSCNYVGDTRGGESSPWYCKLILAAVGDPQSIAFTRQGVVG